MRSCTKPRLYVWQLYMSASVAGARQRSGLQAGTWLTGPGVQPAAEGGKEVGRAN